MTEEFHRSVIQIFKVPDQIIDGCASGTCSSCDSRASCGEPKESFEEMLARLYLGFGDRADVQLSQIDTSSEASIAETIDTLNEMLEARKADERVTRDNFEQFLARRSPLIAVDGVLFFVGVIPTDKQMSRALEIMSKSAD